MNPMRKYKIGLVLLGLLTFVASSLYFLGEEEFRALKLEENQPEAVSALLPPLSNSLSDFEGATKIDRQMERLLKRWDIVGASVAIVKEGRLVFSKGYGHRSLDSGEAVGPEDNFRIASISKLITALGIMQLREAGVLDLGQKVFGESGILNQPEYSKIRDRRVSAVSVRDLLYHVGGFTVRLGDPMFNSRKIAQKTGQSLPLSTEQHIAYALKHQRLRGAPGRRYEYSNLGYAILGEVIESISGMTYEDYVQHYVLNPLGIYGMHLGDSRKGNDRGG